jgi:hypothetical protein
MKRINELFIGYIPHELSKVSESGVRYFESLIDAYVKQSNQNSTHTYLRLYTIQSFPLVKKIFVKSIIKNNFYNIGFINVPVIKQINQIISVLFYILKIIFTIKINRIIFYNSYLHFSFPALVIKLLFPKIEMICVLADVPINVKKSNILINYLSSIYNYVSFKLSSIFSRYIILNKNAIYLFPKVKRENFLLIEGGISPFEINDNIHQPINPNYIFYSGTLDNYSGMEEFVELFVKSDLKINFLICGSGFFEKKLKLIMDKRIHFLGKIDRKKVLNLQKDALFLLNPKITGHKISKYTFPSKILEYLSSGNLVVSTSISMSNQLSKHIFFFDLNDFNTFRKILDEILNLSLKLRIIRIKEQNQTLKNHYLWNIQASKLYNFINKNNE